MLLGSTCAGCGSRRLVVGGPSVCSGCIAEIGPAPALATPLHLDACVGALDYDGASAVITSMKNGQRRDVAGWVAERIVEVLEPPPGAVVTWAPTTAARRRARGFDQAELLARAAARRWGLSCRPLLVRQAPAQAGRSAGERRANPAFRAVRRAPVTVVLVDDVATTGATLTAAARALRAAGANLVIGAVAARSARTGAGRRTLA